MSGCDICGDDRFELVEKYRAKLIDSTNIEDRPEEMAVIDNILFRFWQMGWLDQLEKRDNEFGRLKIENHKLKENSILLPRDADGILIHVGDWITSIKGVKVKVAAVTTDAVYWWEVDGCHWCRAFEVRHYREPTVEDVLLEFGIDWECANDGEDKTAVVKEYAAKLHLTKEDK